MMATLIMDRALEGRLRAERAESGSDRYDEVWEGTYMMAPMPNIEHQDLVNRLATIFQEIIGWPELGIVLPGCNVSDRKEDWQENYRVPDVAVVLSEGGAQNLDTHWCGGPDFVVEVVSRDDKTREKLPFYAAVGVRELLVVDRAPWRLELYRLVDRQLTLAGTSELPHGEPLKSEILPFTFCLVASPRRPRIHVVNAAGEKEWHV